MTLGRSPGRRLAPALLSGVLVLAAASSAAAAPAKVPLPIATQVAPTAVTLGGRERPISIIDVHGHGLRRHPVL